MEFKHCYGAVLNSNPPIAEVGEAKAMVLAAKILQDRHPFYCCLEAIFSELGDPCPDAFGLEHKLRGLFLEVLKFVHDSHIEVSKDGPACSAFTIGPPENARKAAWNEWVSSMNARQWGVAEPVSSCARGSVWLVFACFADFAHGAVAAGGSWSFGEFAFVKVFWGGLSGALLHDYPERTDEEDDAYAYEEAKHGELSPNFSQECGESRQSLGAEKVEASLGIQPGIRREPSTCLPPISYHASSTLL